MTTASHAARSLREARLARVPRRPFTDTDSALDEDWGYQVQDLDRAERLAAGERLVGAKLGLTSRAKQRTMGVAQPIVGFLTDAMQLGIGEDEQVLARTAQPRVEPEIAFRLARDLDRPLSPSTAEQAIDAVAVAVEVIDSRYAAFGFRLPDVVADNTSAAGFLIGPWTHPRQAGDLAAAGCVLSVDGTVAHTATGAAILGHPFRALVHLSEHLARRGDGLPAGAVVLAGALTDAVPVRPAAVHRAEIRGLGAVELVTGAP
ncbi:2-keto-4-pentenoate hydratase [Blastococcus mobilis]|uniref:2-oxo-3-hexenedioate decarboxylase n=1 Tax=Blastococcus mobilis TaxID=1938746 RepID=A0A238Y8X9_9ACTN|nr:fumarylacetoacetate hydrolase family protein [Blastococcus mobilis]SNR67726.1 2-oxo-3-hexenedioate decarboxylase [Blastococcus mobilis]